jgi:hypothetical protein
LHAANCYRFFYFFEKFFAGILYKKQKPPKTEGFLIQGYLLFTFMLPVSTIPTHIPYSEQQTCSLILPEQRICSSEIQEIF